MDIKNLLIIDDEESVRDAFVMALEDSNYQVDTAASGEDGLEQLNQKDYSLIFLDLKMPGINGVKTLIRIRKINATVPVYIVTAFSKEFMAELLAAKDQGLQFEILKKPLGAAQIVETTEAIIGARSANAAQNSLVDSSIVLKIYVAGVTPNTQSAIVIFKEALGRQLITPFSVTIIDVIKHPELATDADITATPTLVRQLPEPVKKLIIDLNDQENISIAIEMIKN